LTPTPNQNSSVSQSESVFIKQHSHVSAYVTKMTDAAPSLRAKCHGRRWLGAREWRHSDVDTQSFSAL